MWLAITQIVPVHAAEPPCDKYPAARETLCRDIWKQLNDQAIADIAQFGLAQQQKREAGQITAAQHLAENMAFIKASTDQRLKKLDERMAAGK
ncbi:MAG: hypothetical protein U0172_14365 [Nitrospiraceae bacterium]